MPAASHEAPALGHELRPLDGGGRRKEQRHGDAPKQHVGKPFNVADGGGASV